MLSVSVQKITPGYARQILDRNTENFRKIDWRKVNQYAREMQAGLWRDNGEGIQIYNDGTLANGQHRLHAIIKSGVTIRMVVVTGVDKSVKTFDRHMNRSSIQIARAMGYKNVTTQELGAIDILMFGLSDTGRYGTEEVIEFYSRIPMIDEITQISSKYSDHGILRKSACIAAMFCAVVNNAISVDDLTQFARITNSGIPVDGYVCNAPLCLRKTLQAGLKTKTGLPLGNGSNSRQPTFEVTYQAICDFVKGSKRISIYKQNGNGNGIVQVVQQKLNSFISINEKAL